MKINFTRFYLLFLIWLIRAFKITSAAYIVFLLGSAVLDHQDNVIMILTASKMGYSLQQLSCHLLHDTISSLLAVLNLENCLVSFHQRYRQDFLLDHKE